MLRFGARKCLCAIGYLVWGQWVGQGQVQALGPVYEVCVCSDFIMISLCTAVMMAGGCSGCSQGSEVLRPYTQP